MAQTPGSFARDLIRYMIYTQTELKSPGACVVSYLSVLKLCTFLAFLSCFETFRSFFRSFFRSDNTPSTTKFQSLIKYKYVVGLQGTTSEVMYACLYVNITIT